MFNASKQKLMESAIKDSDALDHVTNIISGLECELLQEVADLQDAVGLDPIDVPNPQARQEALASLVIAQMSGDLEGWYAEHVLAEHVENPQDAAAYLALDPEDWPDQKETWAEMYREQGADGSADSLAEHHVNQQFGVSLAEFRRQIVEWEPAGVMQHAMAGNHRAAMQAIREVREEVAE